MGRLSHDPFIQHFSHHHQLQLTQTLTPTTPFFSGCNRQSSGWRYTCRPWNFSLHLSCSQMPQLINHPSHPLHPLSLLPKPLYSAAPSTVMRAATRATASATTAITVTSIYIFFAPPNHSTLPTTPTPTPAASRSRFLLHIKRKDFLPIFVHSISFPGGNYHNGVMNQQQFVHSQSMGGMQMQSNNYQQFQQQPCLSGNSLMNAAVQGFVEGAAQS
ncbi:hypothetical protein Pint_16809 [Pistacia integerrima]|uniref:Uncharacterized protein n=1 Tax=Pistacia integerrima TaxID=434235 RepID=A0ACC0ZBG1_9ROSI|nr:hypothetical protein Pint_16809 [Pistacia integerrima]